MMDVGIFGRELAAPTASRRRTAEHRLSTDRGNTSEVDFLRREVVDLESIIKSLHTSRTDAKQATMLALDESTQRNAALERELVTCAAELEAAQATLQEARSQQASAMVVAASHEAESRVLAVEQRILALELLDSEAELDAARAAEESALSIARTYRRFASEGASRLDETRDGIEAVQQRVLEQLAGLQEDARKSLVVRSLGSLCTWQVIRYLGAGFAKWRALVVTAEHRGAVERRLEAAYRHRDIEMKAARVQLEREKKLARVATDAARSDVQKQLVDGMQEVQRAKAAAAREADLRKQAERNLAECEERAEQRVLKTAAELAAAREELQSVKRDRALLREAQDGAKQTEGGRVADLREKLDARDAEVSKLRAELAAEREARTTEEGTRKFLERLLREEHEHAGWRADEAADLAQLRQEYEALTEETRVLESEMEAVKFELHNLLLARALAS
jgi:chromosome segregation ATPase